MIKLTEDQKETLLDHMNKKLMFVLDNDCGFCTVADEVHRKCNEAGYNGKDYHIFCHCCPLSIHRNDGVSCLNTRHDTLRDSEGSSVGEYELATKKSIENRVDYMIDMVNKHTDAKFGWLRDIKGKDKVIDYELKQKEKKDGRRVS